jgi:hypothetical protein
VWLGLLAEPEPLADLCHEAGHGDNSTPLRSASGPIQATPRARRRLVAFFGPVRSAPKTTIGRVAIEFPVQRLQIGDVVALPEQGSEVEATVAREIDRTELTVRVTLRVEGREDFIKEWPIGEMVTVVRGP